MEPLPIGSGNCEETHASILRVYRLQWSHCQSAVGTARACVCSRSANPCFNGATANRQWEPARASPASSRWRSFNGATANRQWELGRVAQVHLGLPSFNGATANRQWEQGSRASTAPSSARLQWSHCQSAVGTAICGSLPSLIHVKVRFSTRNGCRIDGGTRVAQLRFAVPKVESCEWYSIAASPHDLSQEEVAPPAIILSQRSGGAPPARFPGW